MSFKTLIKVILFVPALALTAGCGGGGGGKTPVTKSDAPAPVAPKATGRAAVSIDFPPRPAARQGSVLPPALERVSVALHLVVNGKPNPEPEEFQEAKRPSNSGGRVSLLFDHITVGRYHARITGYDQSGAVIVQSTEPVSVQAGKLTTMPATLGIVHTATGFQPSALTLGTGDRLVVRQEASLPGVFRLEGVPGCESALERTGVLACTLTNPGTFELHSPEGHAAVITVTPDEEKLNKAKPSLGLVRAEDFLRTGEPARIHFQIHGLPANAQGYTLRPGGDSPPLTVTGNHLEASYLAEGAFLAELVDPQGNAVAQRLVNLYIPEESPEPVVVALDELPLSVSEPVLSLQGAAAAGVEVVLVISDSVLLTLADGEGHFAFPLTLIPGSNHFSVFALDEEGQPGPAVSAMVAFNPVIPPGGLASLQILGLPESIQAGEPLHVMYEAFDDLGRPISFSAEVLVEGVTATQQGPGMFTPLTTGPATVIVRDPLTQIQTMASIQINPGPLAFIRVTPGNSTTRVGLSTGFEAHAADAFGNPIQNLPISWEPVGPIQGLNPLTGVLTPTSSGYGAVRAVSGAIHGDACISINPEPSNT